MSLTPGTQLGPYQITRLIGRGGMGEVFLAEDTRLNRKVAIKFLSDAAATDAQAQQAKKRLLREARAAATLDHPNICAIYEVGEADGQSFIVMQYVEGETLAERIKRQPLDRREALAIVTQVAEALQEAHAHHMIHRDIKPQNIMLTPGGRVKVLDFGLAKVIRGTEAADEAETTNGLTASGTIVGTLLYMSPEQVKQQELDGRSDLFSFGAVAYELLSGQPPFAAPSQAEILSAILTRQPPPLLRDTADSSGELPRIVGKCLEKDRDRRYQSARELVVDLRHLQRESDQAAPVIAKAHSPRSRAIPRMALTIVVLSVLAVAGAAAYWLATGRQAISSVAVLPFANVNADPDTEYLSEGIADNLIERLSQLPNLKVISRAAVSRYKGREIDTRAVGRELDVQALLTGRVVKRNDTLTITLELVDATDGTHMWSQQYDRQLADLLTLQREIPLDVTDRLRVRLSGDARERLAAANTSSVEAYQLYLKGRYSWELWTPDGSKQAINYFEEAIRQDPNYALAYAGLADAYMFGAGAGLPQEETHRRATEAVTKALSLNPRLGEAHAAFATLLIAEWDFAGAEREFKLAIELSPGYAEARHQYSHLLLSLGRTADSLAEGQKFLELDPVSESPIGHLAWVYAYSRQYDDAIRQSLYDLERYPNSGVRFQLADAYYQKGMFAEAVGEYLKARTLLGDSAAKIDALKDAFAKSGIKGYLKEEIAQLQSEQRVPAGTKDEGPGRYEIPLAENYALLGDGDRAFEWLEKAYARHADGLVRLKENIKFDAIRSDPRFADLQRRVGLPP